MRLLAFVLPVVALAGAAAFVLRPAPEIAPIEPPKAESFAADLVERGEVLARIGACEVCHTAEGGEPYTGGLALHTPFGKLYSTNLTPDAATGIGRWSKDAFVRAMNEVSGAVIAVALAVVYPQWGVTALLVLAVDRFVIRKVRPLRTAFGQA